MRKYRKLVSKNELINDMHANYFNELLKCEDSQ